MTTVAVVDKPQYKKLSIFLLYLRVFAPARRGVTYISIHLLIWFNLAFYLANFFLKVFQCVPRAKIWYPEIAGHCININIPILVTAAINVLSDLLMLCLPIICVWRLQMSTKRKLGVSAIFAAGIFGCFASIMRLEVSVRNRHTKDQTYDWYSEILWTTAEITCGILASCLPALPTFFRHFIGKARTVLSISRTKVSSNQSHDRSLEKPTELYTLSYPRGRKRQLFTGDCSLDQCGELDDDRTQIFTGPSFSTTEAKVGGSSPAVQGSHHREGAGLSVEDASGPCGGILKIVEVDVESGPGQFGGGPTRRTQKHWRNFAYLDNFSQQPPRRQSVVSPITTVAMAQERSGIAVGLNKGHKTTPLNTPKTRISRSKGKASRRTAFVRDIAREVVGLAPYERRVIELLRNAQDKRARKLAKKRLGTFTRGKRKVEDMQRVIAEARRVGAH
ncbi:60S ribosomal protein L36 [Aspergillus mulundensis]|uniref:60S ribosomal protein L36 n=1 Tax=Aspergillus mulundensis TaxID=1810919 RepID=A0A3D8Q813_9EURO|nr:60S ribosomal protein L36 [Aspergillus mulundensis]RDW57956.1 60S ribosomal protein L36 [Aspergillus mulundensis]